MQWYLSHAGNTVHLVALFPHVLSEAEARAMLAETFRAVPGLDQADLPTEDRIAPTGFAEAGPDTAAEAVLTIREMTELPDNPAHYLAPEPGLFDDPALPALRACLYRPGADAPPPIGAVASVLTIAVSHALVEGADLSASMRGRHDRRARRNAIARPFGPLARVGITLGAPVLAGIHWLLSRRERRRPADFGFAVVELDALALRAAARDLGLRRRSLLFGLVLHALTQGPQGRRLSMSYSHMPPGKVLLEDDSQLSVRVNFLQPRWQTRPQDLARHIEDLLARQNEDEVLTQFLNNRVLGWHRRARRWFPRAYKGAFFGFAPYELVLSLVHPLRPGGVFAPFRKARLIGGSFTGTAPSCIMVQANGRVSLCLWIEKTRMARLERLCASLRDLGIEARGWTPQGPLPAAPLPVRSNAGDAG